MLKSTVILNRNVRFIVYLTPFFDDTNNTWIDVIQQLQSDPFNPYIIYHVFVYIENKFLPFSDSI